MVRAPLWLPLSRQSMMSSRRTLPCPSRCRWQVLSVNLWCSNSHSEASVGWEAPVPVAKPNNLIRFSLRRSRDTAASKSPLPSQISVNYVRGSMAWTCKRSPDISLSWMSWRIFTSSSLRSRRFRTRSRDWKMSLKSKLMKTVKRRSNFKQSGTNTMRSLPSTRVSWSRTRCCLPRQLLSVVMPAQTPSRMWSHASTKKLAHAIARLKTPSINFCAVRLTWERSLINMWGSGETITNIKCSRSRSIRWIDWLICCLGNSKKNG